jgi:hypothetical protein
MSSKKAPSAKRSAKQVFLTMKERVSTLRSALNDYGRELEYRDSAGTSALIVALDVTREEQSSHPGVSTDDVLKSFNAVGDALRESYYNSLTGKDLEAYMALGKIDEKTKERKAPTREERNAAASSGKLTGKALEAHQMIEKTYKVMSRARTVITNLLKYPHLWTLVQDFETFKTHAGGKTQTRKLSAEGLYKACMRAQTNKGNATATRRNGKKSAPTLKSVMLSSVTAFVQIGAMDIANALYSLAVERKIRVPEPEVTQIKDKKIQAKVLAEQTARANAVEQARRAARSKK